MAENRKQRPTEQPLLLCASQQHWEEWLKKHHADSSGVWLQIAKKGSGTASVSYAEAVDSALCYGWIDGQKKSYDEKCFLQKFTPRRPNSIWSKINTERVVALIEQGRMQPAGLKEIEAAKQDGRWDAAYSAQSHNDIPEDFQVALDKNPNAKAFFDTLNRANRYSICFRIQTAKKPETRRARIEQFIQMLKDHKTIHS